MIAEDADAEWLFSTGPFIYALIKHVASVLSFLSRDCSPLPLDTAIICLDLLHRQNHFLKDNKAMLISLYKHHHVWQMKLCHGYQTFILLVQQNVIIPGRTFMNIVSVSKIIADHYKCRQLEAYNKIIKSCLEEICTSVTVYRQPELKSSQHISGNISVGSSIPCC